MSSKFVITESPLIALLGNELILREDIQIDRLRELYPEVIHAITPTIYKVHEDYKLDGHQHIILQVDRKDALGTPVKMLAILQGYFCPTFVGADKATEDMADPVWMKISDKNGVSWINQIFKFSDVYQFMRPNIWDAPEEYDQIEFYTYRDGPVRNLSKPYKITLNLNDIIPIPIVNS